MLGPKYTMRPKNGDDVLQLNQTPGPGSYEPKDNTTKMSVIGGKFGGSLRKDKAPNDNPGPGIYDVNDLKSNKGTRFGSENRGKVKKNEMPGPGEYESQGVIEEAVSKNKGPSFGMRLMSNDKDHSPAPGQYDPSVSLAKPSKPAYNFGSEARGKDIKNEGPDPTAYDPKLDFTRQTGPQWGAGSSVRSKMDIRDTPGPGAYDPKTDDGRPKYSMKGRIGSRKSDNGLLGPGSFDPDFKLTKSANLTTRFGSEARVGPVSNTSTPGPGAYNPKLESDRGPKFGSSYRKGLTKVKDTPGPGTYNNNSIFDKSHNQKGVKIGERLMAPKLVNHLAPNAYDPDFKLVKPKVKGGKILSRSMVKTADNNKLGPGAYNPKLGNTLPNWNFGTGRRGELGRKSDAPGPGQYNQDRSKSYKVHSQLIQVCYGYKDKC